MRTIETMRAIPNYPTTEEIDAAVKSIQETTGEQYVTIYVEINIDAGHDYRTAVRCYNHKAINPSEAPSLPEALKLFLNSNTVTAKRAEAAKLRARAEELEKEAQ